MIGFNIDELVMQIDWFIIYSLDFHNLCGIVVLQRSIIDIYDFFYSYKKQITPNIIIVNLFYIFQLSDVVAHTSDIIIYVVGLSHARDKCIYIYHKSIIHTYLYRDLGVYEFYVCFTDCKTKDVLSDVRIFINYKY